MLIAVCKAKGLILYQNNFASLRLQQRALWSDLEWGTIKNYWQGRGKKANGKNTNFVYRNSAELKIIKEMAFELENEDFFFQFWQFLVAV